MARPRRSSASAPSRAQRWKIASAAGVLKSSSRTAAELVPVARRPCLAAERVAQALDLHGGGGHRLLRELERLAPVAGHQEEQRDLPAPLRDHLLDRRDVADRLRHLLAREAEQAVVHPDPGERTADGLRLRALVLVMREDEVEPTAVDQELGPERLLGHRRALDVPAGPARAPRASPTRCPRPPSSPSRARSRVDPP